MVRSFQRKFTIHIFAQTEQLMNWVISLVSSCVCLFTFFFVLLLLFFTKSKIVFTEIRIIYSYTEYFLQTLDYTYGLFFPRYCWTETCNCTILSVLMEASVAEWSKQIKSHQLQSKRQQRIHFSQKYLAIEVESFASCRKTENEKKMKTLWGFKYNWRNIISYLKSCKTTFTH